MPRQRTDLPDIFAHYATHTLEQTANRFHLSMQYIVTLCYRSKIPVHKGDSTLYYKILEKPNWLTDVPANDNEARALNWKTNRKRQQAYYSLVTCYNIITHGHTGTVEEFRPIYK